MGKQLKAVDNNFDYRDGRGYRYTLNPSISIEKRIYFDNTGSRSAFFLTEGGVITRWTSDELFKEGLFLRSHSKVSTAVGI